MNDNFWIELATDLVFATTVVFLGIGIVYLLAGTWPFMVGITSGSMMPNMYKGDLIFLQGISRTTIKTYQVGAETGYTSFGGYGDVVVYRPNGDPEVIPIIHRVMYWVDAGEPMPNGEPAPHAGFITKGDNNDGYDQPVLTDPVKPDWIVGVVRVRVPYLGYLGIRLIFSMTYPIQDLTIQSGLGIRYAN
ncbi:MAG: signal peptidase I [Methanocellales archaeon]|nr:signal peptidase I [Methanocellales archaeon]MDD3291666.1 signal peptidase I [Methanocellales archaeon]MDD5235016.1 signal peptidase I [Methanocellales archaeon]MDD5485154.1 signal peptidase I [Methanocellales archaeon]